MKNIILFAFFIGLSPNIYADLKKDQLIGCVLKPNKEVKVSSPVTGVLLKVNVKKGDYIKKGQEIARLDNRQELARLKTAKTKAEYAKRKLQRHRQLIDSNMISSNEIDEMKTELRVANSEVDEINSTIETKTIYSPISGYITEGDISKGEYVGSEAVVKISDISFLYADMIVHSSAFGNVIKGEVIELEILSPVNQKRKAKIKQIDKMIDAASGTFNIRAYFSNKIEIPAGIKCSIAEVVSVN